MNFRFTVEGPLLGYRASIRRAFDPKYKAFKERVRWTAMAAGFDPAQHDPERVSIHLSVFLFWKNRPRFDWSNGYKAVEDSLWKQDRWVRPGLINGFKEHSSRPNEEAEILIEVKEK